jgi:hypothetical protein
MAAVTKNRTYGKIAGFLGNNSTTDDGRQVMAKAHMAFGQVS